MALGPSVNTDVRFSFSTFKQFSNPNLASKTHENVSSSSWNIRPHIHVNKEAKFQINSMKNPSYFNKVWKAKYNKIDVKMLCSFHVKTKNCTVFPNIWHKKFEGWILRQKCHNTHVKAISNPSDQFSFDCRHLTNTIKHFLLFSLSFLSFKNIPGDFISSSQSLNTEPLMKISLVHLNII